MMKKKYALLVSRYVLIHRIFSTKKIIDPVPIINVNFILAIRLQIFEVFSLINQTLVKDLLQFLNRIAHDVYMAGSLQRFPYKSFGETLNLVMTSMMREILRNKKG